MRELDDFTVERLIQLANTPEKYDHRYLCNMLTASESRALARIALAAKTAGPVAFRVGERLFCSLYAAGGYASEMKLTIEPLYLEAQPTSPELPDGWIACAERMPDDSHPRARVLAYTPNQDDAMTYRALPAGLFRTVARDATHWKYIEPPTTEK